MSMTTTAYELKLGLQFTIDGDQYPSEDTTVTIPLSESVYIGDVATRVKEINKVLGGGSSTDTIAQSLGGAMHEAFVMYDDTDDDIAYLSEISSVRTVLKQEEVVYSG